MKKILAVHSNKKTENHLNTVNRVKEILQLLPEKEVLFINSEELNEELIRGKDLIITIGGDGTFTKAANYIDKQFILGINSDPETSEGALKSITSHELDKLTDILNGKFKTIERQRAEILINGKKTKEKALSIIFLGAAYQFRASRYKIKYQGKEEEQRSSGVIVSTGTGSNAWFKSVGGIPFSASDKQLKFIIREPYIGNRVFKPALLYGDILYEDKFEVTFLREDDNALAIDDKVYELNKNDKVEIRLSDNPLKVVIL